MPVTHVSTAMLLQGQQYNLKVQPHDTARAKGGKLRLDAYLAAALAAGNAASRAKVQEAIKAGLVSINGKQANKASCAVRCGDQVQATLLPAPTLQALPEAIPLDIVYEDDHLMVVNKPAASPQTAPGAACQSSPALHGKGEAVDWAGVVGRVYCSITLGCPHPASGRVLTNIDRDPGERKRMAAFPYGSTQGRLAASNYLVLQSLAGGAAALVQWQLETGRTHQIRVHGKHLGHPLIGDATYGGAGVAAVNAMGRCNPSRQQDLRSVVMPLSRPTLHAKSLAFEHPATGQRLEFESQLPKDFQELLQSLQQLD
ncbi:pseudouridine synthase [Haematococcus lacustris]